MKTICAWCYILISETSDNGDISHGICRDCVSDMRSVPIGSLQSFLDKIEAPILLVDCLGVVQLKNFHAQKSLNKSDDEILGFRGGDVFDCIHSSKPGGCGSTIHCKACVIRNTVEETYKTGHSFNKIPATLKVVKNSTVSDISSYITTSKSGEFVFLKIDDIQNTSIVNDPSYFPQ